MNWRNKWYSLKWYFIYLFVLLGRTTVRVHILSFYYLVDYSSFDKLRVMPLRSLNPERPYCPVAIATDDTHSYAQHLSLWRHVISRCDVTFSRLYTPCYSDTKDVITSKCLHSNITKFLFQLCDAVPLNLNYGVCYQSKHTLLNRLWHEILGSIMWMENVL
jgi:hypothetical protein